MPKPDESQEEALKRLDQRLGVAEAAQARLNDLRLDAGWRERYFANGSAERAEYDKLVAIVAQGRGAA